MADIKLDPLTAAEYEPKHTSFVRSKSIQGKYVDVQKAYLSACENPQHISCV